ncbi:hypothetical protein [Phocoenobacter skyensis]|uniref:Uncharacterized protein n=1 Tax=Phocoenobacter skyensis TaxID=97481 RepID=A0A1H7XMQ2_9PAST|nr:hypothetical protein [Pasteurella skyensis]MDP8184377.1 hypothetical protein [Pasteurella skyensis]SEM34269.1 hypothetical protein SAMN05444853_11317 [Pasteurella skyensis]
MSDYCTEETNSWQEYEQRKRELYQKNLTQSEYEKEIRKILQELEL